jgi:hypothetical protein
MEDIFIAIGFIVCSLAIIYYFGQCMSLNTSIIEGLENAEKPDAVAPKGAGGVGANATGYLAAIKAIKDKAGDVILVDKYGKEYGEIIVAWDDLIDTLMLKTVLTMNPESPGQSLQSLNVMKNSKDALNDVMKFIDKTGGSSATSSSSLGF